MNIRLRTSLFALFLLSVCGCVDNRIPAALVKNEYGCTQISVDGQPFLMLCGELGNSSASTKESIDNVWEKLEVLNLNSVLATIAWEQFEPEEGVYDYELLDALIEGGRKHDIKVGILWFASWKNGESSYAPSWVKEDRVRFKRVLTKDGGEIETLSPFCEETMKADARAYAALVSHIKDCDKSGTIIVLQPENEVGVFQDIDYSPEALLAYQAEVPSSLIEYLTSHKEVLRPELESVWSRGGYKTSGVWQEVFPEEKYAKQFLMTWQYGRYINYISEAGKQVYPLPTYCNAWLVQYEGQEPGLFPNGGPVSMVMDIWKAAAPSVDILSPDIYLPDFKGIVADFHRADNPVLIPEAKMKIENAYYAIGEEDAMCFSPFAIENGIGNMEFANGYSVLSEISPFILKYQGSDRIHAFTGDRESPAETVIMGDAVLNVSFIQDNAYGIVIKTGEHEYLAAGLGLQIKFSSNNPSEVLYLEQVLEGGFCNSEWYTTRMLNGDETNHHHYVRTIGRPMGIDMETFAVQANTEAFVYSPEKFKTIYTSGIYNIKTYLR